MRFQVRHSKLPSKVQAMRFQVRRSKLQKSKVQGAKNTLRFQVKLNKLPSKEQGAKNTKRFQVRRSKLLSKVQDATMTNIPRNHWSVVFHNYKWLAVLDTFIF